MATPVNRRVQKHRDAMRAQGLRPVQMWLPDTRDPNFRAEMARAARLINEADAEGVDLQERMEATWRETLAEIEEMEARSEAALKAKT